MRDISIARRKLLALSVGSFAAGWAGGPAIAEPRRHRPHSVRLPGRKPLLHLVAIDAGHGGEDPGAISPGGLYEKTVTLAMARELARQLEITGRYRPLLTRRGDVFVPLRERVARARAKQAELLLSIHADALPNSALRGLSVYTLSEGASDRETAALPARETREDFVAGMRLSRQPPDIAPVLLDLARRDTNNRSLAIAQAIVDELSHLAPLLEKPHRSAGFVVLTAPDTPSALVELGCLSNPADERLLQQPTYQQQLAHGLKRAIDDYFSRPPAA